MQPQVAMFARAGTYDHAGRGYSDPAAHASNLFNVVADLRALIKAAYIDGPVVLVGHSLGGFNMKLFAAPHPQEVGGLVLVDPSEDRLKARTRELVRAKFGAEGWRIWTPKTVNWTRTSRGISAALRRQQCAP